MIENVLNRPLCEIEKLLIANNSEKPNYSNESFRAITSLFMSALLDKIVDFQEKESLKEKDIENMSFKAGNEVKKIIKVYTDIDTKDLF